MSLFDKTIKWLDHHLLDSQQKDKTEEEFGHLALLQEAEKHVRSTVEAIQRGKLIASSSRTEDMKVRHMMRYQSLLKPSEPVEEDAEKVLPVTHKPEQPHLYMHH